jgi:hypothetical protein
LVLSLHEIPLGVLFELRRLFSLEDKQPYPRRQRNNMISTVSVLSQDRSFLSRSSTILAPKQHLREVLRIFSNPHPLAPSPHMEKGRRGFGKATYSFNIHETIKKRLRAI